MIDEAERPAHRAILHFYLAVYGKERADHREKALRLYDELLTAENHPLFRWRIAQLVAIEG